MSDDESVKKNRYYGRVFATEDPWPDLFRAEILDRFKPWRAALRTRTADSIAILRDWAREELQDLNRRGDYRETIEWP